MTERRKMGLKLIISGLILIVAYLLAKPELNITQELNMPFKLGERVNLDRDGEYVRLDKAFAGKSIHHIISFKPIESERKDYNFDQFILFYTKDNDLSVQMIVGYRHFETIDECNIFKERFDSKVRNIEGLKKEFDKNDNSILTSAHNRIEYFTSNCEYDGIKNTIKYSAYFLIK